MDYALENVLVAMSFGSGRPDRARAAELLDAVGLGHRLDHRPSELSVGQQQRVAVARALANRPRAVLADEPTGSLDFATGEKVMALMFEMNRETGTTLVLVTHDRAIATRYDQLANSFLGMVHIATARYWLKFVHAA